MKHRYLPRLIGALILALAVLAVQRAGAAEPAGARITQACYAAEVVDAMPSPPSFSYAHVAMCQDKSPKIRDTLALTGLECLQVMAWDLEEAPGYSLINVMCRLPGYNMRAHYVSENGANFRLAK